MVEEEHSTWHRIAQVAQASGVVSVQAGCTPNQAYVLMTARCELTRTSIEQIAVAVLEHRTRFD